MGLTCLSGNDDARSAKADAAHQREQRRRVGGRQADATMRGTRPQIGRRISAVDGVSAAEEYRVRHWRIVVFFRAPHAGEPLRAIAAIGRVVAYPTAGDGPAIDDLPA